LNAAGPPDAAVFLDRDGTLIRDVGYLRQVGEMEILPKVPEALRLLKEGGFKLVVVTNQSAVARGWLSEHDLGRIHEALSEKLGRSGASLDGIYYCPHHPTEGSGAYRIECACRKPRTGMIERACAELKLNPAHSYMVGDQEIDMELAQRVGSIGVLISSGIETPVVETDRGPMVRVNDLWHAAKWILRDYRRPQ